MAKSNITKKRSLNIKGVVDICKEDNTIYITLLINLGGIFSYKLPNIFIS